MGNELVKKEFNDEAIAIVRDSIMPKGSSDTELQYFLEYCKRTGLDPISRQIYALRLDNKISVVAAIDGLRLVAERSGKYAGQRGPYWCGDDGEWKDVWLSAKMPIAAKVCVLRHDFAEPLCAVAKMASYNKGTFVWNKMPEHMIAKVAESLALRRAFPNELSGIYAPEELDQAQNAPEADAPRSSESRPYSLKTAEADLDEKAKAAIEEAKSQGFVPPPVPASVATELAAVDAEFEDASEDLSDDAAFDESSNVLNPTATDCTKLQGWTERKETNAKTFLFNRAGRDFKTFRRELTAIFTPPDEMPEANIVNATQLATWLQRIGNSAAERLAGELGFTPQPERMEMPEGVRERIVWLAEIIASEVPEYDGNPASVIAEASAFKGKDGEVKSFTDPLAQYQDGNYKVKSDKWCGSCWDNLQKIAAANGIEV